MNDRTIAIQTWQNRPADLWRSPVWARPEVVPYLEVFFSFNHGQGTNAGYIAAEIDKARGQFVDAHPNVPFRYALWPHRWSEDGITGATDTLLAHRADRLADGTPGPFTAKGREAFRAESRRLLHALKPELIRRGLPDPVAVSSSNEAQVSVCPDQSPEARAARHALLMADPRSRRETLNGVVTYADFTHGLRGLTGKRITSLYPWIYDGDRWADACLYSSLHHMIVDSAMDEALYKACREVFPGVKCMNWATFASTRQFPAHTYRFQESPVDANAGGGWKADYMLPAAYGNDPNDKLEATSGRGYNTFTEQLRRFKIAADYADRDALARQMHAAQLDYFLRGVKAHGVPVAISLAWCGQGIWSGPQKLADPARIPAEMLGATLDYNDVETARAVFATLDRHNVDYVEIFAQDATRAGLDRMADTLDLVDASAGTESAR